MPRIATDTREPRTACSLVERVFAHRSSPFSVESEPLVIESPRAATTIVSCGAMTSTASRKNHDVVVKGNARSSYSALCAPLSGALRYEVLNAPECHVIRPVDPAT